MVCNIMDECVCVCMCVCSFQHSTINNLAFGRSVEETKRVLQAIQYVQSNPDEVCPAGWKPGDKVRTHAT